MNTDEQIIPLNMICIEKFIQLGLSRQIKFEYYVLYANLFVHDGVN